jgi:hypothetical protein
MEEAKDAKIARYEADLVEKNALIAKFEEEEMAKKFAELIEDTAATVNNVIVQIQEMNEEEEKEKVVDEEKEEEKPE